MNNRKIGDQLEEKVLDILGPSFCKTAGSGSVFKDADLRNKNLVVEIKVRSTAGASFAGADYKKLKAESNKQGKEWIFICQNFDKDIIAMMDVNYFAVMHEENLIAEELRKENNELYKKLYNKVTKKI